MSHIPEDRSVYTIHEVAPILRYSSRTIRRMIDAKQIRAVRIRARWMIPHVDLIRFIETRDSNQN